MQANEYDLVVIGSGPAGQKGAICAAKMRKKVAVIDRRLAMGGVCVHSGTIPSKVMREAVLYLSGLRQRSFYGRGYVVKDRIMMSDLVLRAQAVMTREVDVIKAQLRRNYVTALEGDAHFADPHTIEVVSEDGVQQIRGEKILIACGTRPAHIDGIPVDGKRIFDSDVKDIMWFNPGGAEMNEQDWKNGFAKCLGMLISGLTNDVRDPKGEPVRDDTFLMLFNAHYEPLTFILPGREEIRWELVLDTKSERGFVRPQKIMPAGDEVELIDRSLCLLKLREGEDRFAREPAWTTREGKSPSKVPTHATEPIIDGK